MPGVGMYPEVAGVMRRRFGDGKLSAGCNCPLAGKGGGRAGVGGNDVRMEEARTTPGPALAAGLPSRICDAPLALLRSHTLSAGAGAVAPCCTGNALPSKSLSPTWVEAMRYPRLSSAEREVRDAWTGEVTDDVTVVSFIRPRKSCSPSESAEAI